MTDRATAQAQHQAADDAAGFRSVLRCLLAQSDGADRFTRYLLFQHAGDVMAFTRTHPNCVRKVAT